MNRAKPYKILFVLAVMVAGGICMLLPDKNAIPVASVETVVKGKACPDTVVCAPKNIISDNSSN